MFAPAARNPMVAATAFNLVTDPVAHETRNRGRLGHSTVSNTSASHTVPEQPWSEDSPATSYYTDAKSPPPLANDRYQLAEGMERPGLSTSHSGDYDDYFQLEKQRGMWTPGVQPHTRVEDAQSDVISSTPDGSKQWVLGQLINLVGGVAGTLIQFCSRPFRGFKAGGGRPYVFGSGDQIPASGGDLFLDTPTPAPVQNLVPGEYPEEDYGVLSVESLNNERPSMSKRLRTGESWVMVGRNGTVESRPSTPRMSERRTPGQTQSPSQIPRPVGTPTPGSLVSKRPSLIPVSRRTPLGRRDSQGASDMAPRALATPRSYNRQGYGSPAMFRDSSSTKKSPLSAESQRLINQRRREELEDDARLRRMSSQMSQMLREAQEALGRKVDVDELTGEADDPMWQVPR
ncbi:hypothetical protein M011DRAFT_493497 [Sporormia fimetaria CBS 119925]|uniref:Uncharacterized protein n=1 Tax=Sporormia fimetaria CBS 119925 TaxID=1340428 RepID=A0A6A6VDK2_9PLEO|nr:hypothetical protein M011DRAFT_493497 [Sporormia fimetaria CBS 119925]